MYRVMVKREGEPAVLKARTRRDALRIMDALEPRSGEIVVEDEARRCFAAAEFRQHCRETRHWRQRTAGVARQQP